MKCLLPSSQVDSLDTLALLGDRERFTTSVEWIGKNLQFDIVSNALFLKLVFNACGVTSMGFNNSFSIIGLNRQTLMYKMVRTTILTSRHL